MSVSVPTPAGTIVAEIQIDEARIDALLAHIASVKDHDYQQLIKLSQEALATAEQIDYWRGMARSHYYIAWSFLRLGQFNLAGAPAKNALMIAQEHHLPIEEGFGLSALGAVQTYIGNFAEGLECFQKQLKIAEKHNHPQLLELALHDIGVHYCQMGQLEKGIDLFKQSLQVIEANGLKRSDKWMKLESLGISHGLLGQPEQALGYFEQALALSEREQVDEGRLSVLINLGRTKGENQQYEAAYETLGQAMSLAREIGSALECDIFSAYGQVCWMQNDRVAAIEHFNRALEFAEKAESQTIIAIVLDALAQIHAEQGDYQQAFECLRRLQKIKDRLEQEHSRSRIEVLNTLYELDNARREAEIHRLHSEAAKHELHEYRRTEAERLEIERLKGALEKERELAVTKEHILTRIYHEFRTPLAIIRTSTELLTRYANRMDEAKKESYRNKIQDQFDWIEKQLGDIGMVLKAKNLQAASSPQPVDLRQLCEQAVLIAQKQTSTEGRICLNLQSSVDHVLTDELIVKQILVELLTNALKFSEDMVQFRVSTSHEMLTIRVEDKGIGIPVEEQKLVFEPLARGSNLDEVRGNGLGLTIVRDYVTLLQGNTHLNSVVNQGTEILVTIPLKASTQMA